MSPSTLESLTRLPSEPLSVENWTRNCGCGEGCGCCGCQTSLMPLSLPQETAERSGYAETEA